MTNKNITKAIGVIVGVALTAAITTVVIYVGNYGWSAYTTYTLTSKYGR